ncbi:SCO-spondin-like isoform X2 [Antedon mediterranea]|uniref:SCO-spondin-like isoform X2 n=1 Tax=Antedon mediterranea TaxID=105859 RepID=UPI003AF4C563
MGSDFEGRPCVSVPCPINGYWLEWNLWSECTLTCGSGERRRNRQCVEPQYNGLPCLGTNNETEICNTQYCRVNGTWLLWTEWSSCPVSCAGGTEVRNRTCDGPYHGGDPCLGEDGEVRECNTHPCPIDGGFSEWTQWTVCSSTCNYGLEVRKRWCNNPQPMHDGKDCSGAHKQNRECYIISCPRHGGWSTWSEWTTCTAACGWGARKRYRACDNPVPTYGGAFCVGTAIAAESCIEELCPVHASWGLWGEWGNCSQSCGAGGTYMRERECDSPPPMYGGDYCIGSNSSVADCYVQRCEGDGGYTEWSDWGVCSKECETGVQQRTRTCTNPPPTPPDGQWCHGVAEKSRPCNTHICPVHGGWAEWSPWTLCAVTCGGDTITRDRVCTNPPPLFDGDFCEGEPFEEIDCNINGCPVNGAWTLWSEWSSCSVTCAGGTRDRTRTCTNPATAWGGIPCPEDDETQQSETCNMFPCPIDGGWSGWSEWADCPVTCDGFELTRTRTCDNPVPQYDGNKCPGEPTDEFMCNDQPCLVDGDWSTWSVWSDCSEPCEGGTQTRSRSCSDPAPAYGGFPCPSNFTEQELSTPDGVEQVETEEMNCNEHLCPIHGGYTEWTKWPECPVTCGGAEIWRNRNCTNPVPQYDGDDCQGPNTGSKLCNDIVQCPIHGNWGRWLYWSMCSKQCEGGESKRIRLCNNPSPLYGGKQCNGTSQETKTCNEHRCPVHGGYSKWSPWEPCSKSCGGGQTLRTRTCTNPVPQFDGNPCYGTLFERKLCSAFYCSVHGGYSEWSEWSLCPVSCDGGPSHRIRVCNSPSPKHGGDPCEGPSTESTMCNTMECPVDGSWTAWSDWSDCSQTCDLGYRSSRRSCSDPQPQFGGLECQGEAYKMYYCPVHSSCPVMPSAPVNITFSVVRSEQYIVIFHWDTNAQILSTQYYSIQAKRLQTPGIATGNTTFYDWHTFGTVYGAKRSIAVRNSDEVGLFQGNFEVRVISGNVYGETVSKVMQFNVAKYLTGQSAHTSPARLLLIILSCIYLIEYIVF